MCAIRYDGLKLACFVMVALTWITAAVALDDHCARSVPQQIMHALKKHADKAEHLCRPHRKGESATSTFESGQRTVTVTYTIHAAPTLIMTVARDFVTTKFVSSDCASPPYTSKSLDAIAAGVAIAPSLGTVASDMQGVEQEMALAHLLAPFQLEDVEEACKCISSDTNKYHGTNAVSGPGQISTITETYTMLDQPPMVSTVYLDSTHTVYEAEC